MGQLMQALIWFWDIIPMSCRGLKSIMEDISVIVWEISALVETRIRRIRIR